MTEKGSIHARRLIDRWRPGGTKDMTILEKALAHIELRRQELLTRIEETQRELTWLEDERNQILEAAAAAKAAHGETARAPLVDR